jgi:hypothetical protein
MSEIYEAAERYRANRDGINAMVHPRELPYTHLEVSTGAAQMCHDAWNRDAHTLANAYLDATTLASRPVAASVRELLSASKEVLRKCDSEHEGVTIYDADRLREAIAAVETAPASADPRQIFDAGFAACRAYGDNHFHYRGEQADRVFAKAMERLNITPAIAEVGK